jgi:anti-sigma28 factor (negative regulator of flagellin synthesis)
MLKAGKPISEVIEFSDLSEERVLELKKEIEAGNV